MNDSFVTAKDQYSNAWRHVVVLDQYVLERIRPRVPLEITESEYCFVNLEYLYGFLKTGWQINKQVRCFFDSIVENPLCLLIWLPLKHFLQCNGTFPVKVA